jgi:hypothetical protein
MQALDLAVLAEEAALRATKDGFSVGPLHDLTRGNAGRTPNAGGQKARSAISDLTFITNDRFSSTKDQG